MMRPATTEDRTPALEAGTISFEVGSWSGAGAGGCIDGARTCNVVMDGRSRTVHVTFERKVCTLTLTAGVGGTVSGGGWKDENSHASIRAKATTDNYVFTRWSGASVADSTDSSTTIHMVGGNKSVTAHFDHICNLDSTFPGCARRADEEGEPPTQAPDPP